MNNNIIATLTFQGADSYGAMLQAYALQQTILRLGYTTELLNYECKQISEKYSVPRTARGLVGRALRTPWYQIRRQRFRQFRTEFLLIGPRFNKKNISLSTDRYDVIVAGSDQIWNPDITGGDTTFFLDFADSCRKISYAASIGVGHWGSKDQMRFSEYLKAFDFLSVREAKAQQYLSSVGIISDVTCDPTFLLEKSSYSQMLLPIARKRPFTLLLCLENPNGRIVTFAKEVATERGEDLVALHTGRIVVGGVTNVRSAGPREFLSYIDAASCVVTESFHACCFALLFNKQLYYVGKHSEDPSLDRSSRITDLLGAFDLSDRDKTLCGNLEPDIDFTDVNTRIQDIRERSLSWLRGALANE